MTTVTAAEFTERAPELLESVEAGETVIVQRDGKSVARLEPAAAATPGPKRRVTLPFVPSARPGSVRLTAERVAELLEDEDVPS
jgi:antitoxin (DNA-binding transcriptional repressor) of toxin-antitoxin stability system